MIPLPPQAVPLPHYRRGGKRAADCRPYGVMKPVGADIIRPSASSREEVDFRQRRKDGGGNVVISD